MTLVSEVMTHYHEVAGTRVDRIAALSDALFAIALTLTVLEVRLPAHQTIMTEHDLRAAILQIAPRMLTYLLSFMTLGIFWIGQQVLLNHLHRTDRRLTWLFLGFLATIAILPISTGFLADYITYRTAVVLYWLNILAIGIVSLAANLYARGAGLVYGRAGVEAISALWRRLVVGQVLYALGAVLCLIHPFWSIAFIVTVQAYFAFGPNHLSRRMHHPKAPVPSPVSTSRSIVEERDESVR